MSVLAISRAAERRRLFEGIGAFLEEHALPPTPGNYLLAYELMVDAGSPIARQVRAATADGVRLAQEDADAILAACGHRQGVPEQREEDRATPAFLAAAHRQAADLSALVDLVQTSTRDYGRDLAVHEERLRTGADSLNEIVNITGAMVQRTRAAERQLEAARQEAQALRAKLADVEQQAHCDVLTGLPNRRAFEERWAKLCTSAAPSSLAICDVDRFKSINDRYGHGVGDRVLKLIARTIQESCGKHFVARLGGEEFVVLFEGLEPEEAGAILDDARAALAARHFRLRENDEPLGTLTFSAGVAPTAGGEGGQDALKRADDLLYQAKEEGRNRVRVAA